MRSETQMLDLILDTARDDERIRAVILNGSRANPNAPRDILRDFDIVYFVTDTAPYIRNQEWIKRFGELMILQMPDDMQDPAPSGEGGFAYLMQFTDGNRIDLGILPLDKIEAHLQDSLSVVLLDKDGIVPPLPPSSEAVYLPKPPTARAFFDCCNEFWWVSPYVAKGLWRREIVFAKFVLEHYVRDQLMKMLVWYIGMRTGFSHNPGKFGKHFQRYLEPELWDLLLKTYTDASYERTWEAVLAMGDLFRLLASRVCEYFGYEYPQGDDERVSAFLRYLRQLPSQAQDLDVPLRSED